ncbi:GT4 family glycosyltransferase PelF [Corynebacterium breve]|uniref:GT4 family glycosyltransferase PelF n=1 Tax=Corynebacterium breve TaxID=3049799 RepID=A0ABY8VEU4_9CORY|nr:GT4 family glycosyltransferase PelF [Corynebacterium breve]WIM68176.1 GT4 family glycosyltransferase PelF [Corynebacterium breve]
MSGPVFRFPGDDFDLPCVDVALVMESTYPFLKGGVSAVVHDIVVNNPDLTFGVIHISWDSKTVGKDIYGMPANVAWVDVIYLSLNEFKQDFLEMFDRPKLDAKEATNELLRAARSLSNGKTQPMWELYDEAINPQTRTWRLWPVLSTKPFMDSIMRMLPNDDDTSIGQLFWTLRDFFTLSYALMDRVHAPAHVYHAHTQGYAALVAACAARQHEATVLLTEHNLHIRDTINALFGRRQDQIVTQDSWKELPTTTTERMWALWWTALGAWAYPAADHLTYLYPGAVREAQSLGANESKAEILPNGLEWSKFEHTRREREDVVADIAAGAHHHWNLVAISRVVPIKAIIEMIDSIAVLRDRGINNLSLDILGPLEHDLEYAEKCQQHVAKRNLEGIIRFRGTQVVPEVLHDYDALVLSSYNEGQPIVVLEAMSAGLPVIGTEVGGMAMTVTRPLRADDGTAIGPAGRLVAPGDVSAFADAVEELIATPGLYTTFHENALERVRAAFMMEKIMKRYNSLYRELGAGTPLVPGRTSEHELPQSRRARGERQREPMLPESPAPRRDPIEVYPGRKRSLFGGSYFRRRLLGF